MDWAGCGEDVWVRGLDKSSALVYFVGGPSSRSGGGGHKTWFGSAPCRFQPVLTGTLGEVPGRNRERVVFSVVSLGNSAVGSLCGNGGSVIGRVSVADASLSLSLSLWDCRRLGSRSSRRGSAAAGAGRSVRRGSSRSVGALLRRVCLLRFVLLRLWVVGP